jgi:hypothetical protein
MYLRRWAHVTHVNRTLCHETNGDQGAGLQSCYQGEVELRCAPMSKNLQSRFLSCKALWGDPGGEHMAGSGTVGSCGITIQEKQPEQLCPVLHGTEDRNLPSIYQKGPDFAGMRQMDSNWVVIFFFTTELFKYIHNFLQTQILPWMLGSRTLGADWTEQCAGSQRLLPRKRYLHRQDAEYSSSACCRAHASSCIYGILIHESTRTGICMFTRF